MISFQTADLEEKVTDRGDNQKNFMTLKVNKGIPEANSEIC